jgi:hypothetical protein
MAIESQSVGYLTYVDCGASAVYLYTYPSQRFPLELWFCFMLAGIVFPFFWFHSVSSTRSQGLLARVGWILLAAGAILGIDVIKIGTPSHLKSWLYAHIVICMSGAVACFASWLACADGWAAASPNAALGLLRYCS